LNSVCRIGLLINTFSLHQKKHERTEISFSYALDSNNGVGVI